MTLATVRLVPAVLLLCCASAVAQAITAAFPADRRQLTSTISYAEMEAFLREVDGKGPIQVSVEGTTAQGRSVFLVHASRGGTPSFRILFYAQQHGDEVAGKVALLYMIRDIAAKTELLPTDADLWVMPMMNPDGGEAGTRRNAAKADLNRDHIVLEQPETQALYRVVRRVRPHLAVDCHEFGRDSEERRRRGWIAYPDITMDGLNNPLFDPAVIAAAQRWVDEAEAPEAAAGHPFLRYTVGGMPPDEEQRHSAPDIDGGLNAVGMYGGLSFIIESAVMRGASAPAGDLARRVDAYLVLFWRFVNGDGHRQEDLAAVEHARRRPLPAFIPTNYLWVNPGMAITEFPVVDAATGRMLKVPTANMMTVMAVKTAVPTPLAYAVEAKAAPDFKPLLERHGIPFEELTAARTVRAEVCTLLRIEDEFDDLYSRYEGRQIVRREEPAARELPAGSLWVPLEGEAAVRTALVLEPAAMYGPFQYPRFRKLVAPNSPLPVLRILR
ncbi:MAG: succinylglutamate desuccinylase/aspartoacylase family protein [Acidobacteriia bacterium]|nr:succinylglutamate desuccinylase/aspartoacylase family protein [Terriglobia bacterium]